MTGRSPRLQLLVAALLVGAALVAVSAAAGVLGASWRTTAWSAAAAAALLLVAGVGGSLPAVRRGAGATLGAARRVLSVGVAVVAGLVVVVLALGRLPERTEQALVWPVVAGLVVAALAHGRLRADRPLAVGAGRRTPVAVLQAFGERGERGAPAEELMMQLAEALRDDLQLAGAEIWTRSGEGLQRLVAVPHRPVPETAVTGEQLPPLRRTGVAGEAWLRTWLPQLLLGRDAAAVRIAVARYGGEVLGLVLVERARDGERFSSADERRLGDVVGRLGLALHNRQLDSALQSTLDDLRRTNDELRASRSRLVSAADAERRRIERDIHDGAQQHLVALAVNLGLARDLLRDDVQAGEEVLAELSADLKETIAQLRDLAHGVYPPLLRETGLAEALRAAARRSPQPVSVVPGELARYGADVEAAVYFCCLEALQNCAKHAPGATVTVEVGQEGGVLRFSVVDDGPGFGADAPRAGQGLQNMTDRLGAVGGTVGWSSRPGGGAVVEGRVPVPVPAPAAAG